MCVCKVARYYSFKAIVETLRFNTLLNPNRFINKPLMDNRLSPSHIISQAVISESGSENLFGEGRWSCCSRAEVGNGVCLYQSMLADKNDLAYLTQIVGDIQRAP